jgi:hypothetical protein
MESKELRIGNLLLDNDKIICEVKEIRENYILTNSLDNFKTLVAQIGLYEPIPLTEEWLLRFGFVECLDNYILDISQRISLVYFDRNECQFSIIQDVNNEIALKFGAVKYVHQLQNLYFALTGEELTTQELNQ